jgi:hypothetical protein
MYYGKEIASEKPPEMQRTAETNTCYYSSSTQQQTFFHQIFQ